MSRLSTTRMTGLLPIAAVVAIALVGCGSPSAPTAPDTAAPIETAPAAPGLSGELTVYAAASLKAAFDDISAAFGSANPDVEVLPISYDGSSTLATQIIEGAPVDVFASADEANLKKVVDAGLVAGGELFATNTLVIAVPKGNPGGVTAIEDLGDAGLTVVLCDAEVPCGRASQEVLGLAGVTATPVSLEQNVTAVLTKVAAGEADAGLVYATDVVGRDDVESIVPAHADEVVNHYRLAALDGAGNPEAARAFVAYALSEAGQAILEGYGFGRP